MEKLNDLRDLLRHEIQDLYSAEEQIINALPAMIDKARNPELRNALQEHLRVTEGQRARLEQVQGLLGNEEAAAESKSLLSRLFKSRQVCRGMQGVLEEGSKVMREEMDPDVMDAAIIACAQKVEHYEICGYGTARAFATELGLTEVAGLLEQTLNEEYGADDHLTRLAVSRINRKAEGGNEAGGKPESRAAGRSAASRSSAQEKSRTREPEMEMASQSRSGSGTARKTAASGRNNAAPKGSSERSSATGSRSATAASGTGSRRGTSGSASGATGRGSSTTGRSSARGNGTPARRGKGSTGRGGR